MDRKFRGRHPGVPPTRKNDIPRILKTRSRPACRGMDLQWRERERRRETGSRGAAAYFQGSTGLQTMERVRDKRRDRRTTGGNREIDHAAAEAGRENV